MTARSGWCGAIVRGSWVGTGIAAGVISIIYLLISMLAMITWDATGEGFPHRFFWGLLWFGYQIIMGLAFMIIAIPAWWLLHISGKKRAISSVTIGVLIGFLLVIVGSFGLSVAFTGTERDEGWWRSVLGAAAIQGFAGGVVAWFAFRSSARV
jgi:hypothetical protein